MQHEAPSYPEHIDERLKEIDPTFRLVWEPRCAMSGVTRHRDDRGRIIRPVFEGRYELWATDITGKDYMVKVLEDRDSRFKPPGEWLIQERQRLRPERYEGGLDGLIARHVDIPNEERERKRMQESDDAVDDGIDWAAQTETPKSGAGIKYRGDRMFSGGSGGEMSRLSSPSRRRIVTPVRIVVP